MPHQLFEISKSYGIKTVSISYDRDLIKNI